MGCNVTHDPTNNMMLYMLSSQSQPVQRGRGHGSSRKQISVDGGKGDDTIIINSEKLESEAQEEPVAANERGRIWSDPHFRGGDGGRFDVQGQAGKSYSLLSDSGLQLNGRFDKYGEDGTAVGETGLTVTGNDGETSQVNFKKDGTALINGEQMEEGKLYQLADGGTAKLDGKKLTVTTAEGYTIKQSAETWDGDDFININVRTGEKGVDNGQMSGGLLGQTFDADDAARNGKTGHGAQGEGAIDGVVQDYEVDDLFSQESKETADTNGDVVVNGGDGDDRIEVNGPFNGPVRIDGGSGDDTIIINGGTPAPEPDPEQPVAAKETGTIQDGSLFEGGDGGAYDIHGEEGKIYDLLSDSGLEFRGQFDDGGDGQTAIGETGLTVGSGLNSDHINFRKDGTARINGQLMKEGETYDLTDGGTARLENGELTITTDEGYTIKQSAKGSGDRAHINIDVTTGENGVDNGKMPGGLLGQTFDAGNEARNGAKGPDAQGKGAVEGDIGDYECNALDPINENRGTTDESENIGDEFQQFMETLQNLFDKFMELFNQLQDYAQDSVSSPKLETDIDAGSGDDRVEINTAGHHTVNLGSGDDEAFVSFESGERDNSATVNGGSGNDTVTLAGLASDYEESHQADYTVYTDQDGNSIKVSDDVEQVRFEEQTQQA